MLKKMISIGIVLFIIFLGFYYKNDLLFIMKEGGILSILVSIVLTAICVFFPMVPFPVLAAMNGAIFGVIVGMIVSLVGSMLGTMWFFLLTRYGFRDSAQEKLNKLPKVQEYEAFLNQQSFFTIVMLRIIPILPTQVINIICGLSKVKGKIFFLASIIGKLPNIIVLAYAGASFVNNWFLSVLIYLLYVIIVFLLYFLFVPRTSTKKSLD